MIAKHTDELTHELAQEPRKPERAACPLCGGNIVVKRVYGSRILEYHHDAEKGYTRWCDGSDMNIDEYETD